MQVLLYEATGDSKYLTGVNAFLDFVLYQAQKTPLGLVYISEWGSLRHAANVAHLLLQAAALDVRADELQAFASSQLDYMLGSTGRSYVVGLGVNPPQRPHHRGSSCPDVPEVSRRHSNIATHEVSLSSLARRRARGTTSTRPSRTRRR
jgi:hypothetical protein